MRISDWSSDLCSSDLRILRATLGERAQLIDVAEHVRQRHQRVDGLRVAAAVGALDLPAKRVQNAEIGRASCRERVCQYVELQVVAVSLIKKYVPYIYDATVINLNTIAKHSYKT